MFAVGLERNPDETCALGPPRSASGRAGRTELLPLRPRSVDRHRRPGPELRHCLMIGAFCIAKFIAINSRIRLDMPLSISAKISSFSGSCRNEGEWNLAETMDSTTKPFRFTPLCRGAPCDHSATSPRRDKPRRAYGATKAKYPVGSCHRSRHAHSGGCDPEPRPEDEGDRERAGLRRDGRSGIAGGAGGGGQPAAVISTSTRNSGLVKPETMTSVEAGRWSAPASQSSRARM